MFDNDQSGFTPRHLEMNRDGSNQTNLRRVARRDDPAWSPDGTKIVFDGIQVMSANGGPATVVASSGIDPDWQPIPINAYPRPKGATPLQSVPGDRL